MSSANARLNTRNMQIIRMEVLKHVRNISESISEHMEVLKHVRNISKEHMEVLKHDA